MFVFFQNARQKSYQLTRRRIPDLHMRIVENGK